ncbi:MAG: mechanosensitive ion channel [Oscillospiraceae bacterium]|jgi:small conductance mechanosensitive channel|nr:mechanosensitive ion channel [Oscillospiraceae bacterium]
MLLALASVLPEEATKSLWDNLRNITASGVFSAVLAAVAGVIVVKVLLRVLDRALDRFQVDAPLQRLLRALLKGGLWSVAVIIVLDRLGVEVTSLIAVLSVVGLAFSLALQNFLSNVAGGMQLLASHPFSVGDFVEAGGCSGTVEEIGMFYTKLTTPDNRLVQLPNNTIVSANITNFSAQPTRRVELKLTASYDAPVDAVKEALARAVAAHPLTLADPEPMIRVEGYRDSAIEYVVRVWCANADYWTVYYDLLEEFKAAFDAAGIEMTYPHVNVHMLEAR